MSRPKRTRILDDFIDSSQPDPHDYDQSDDSTVKSNESAESAESNESNESNESTESTDESGSDDSIVTSDTDPNEGFRAKSYDDFAAKQSLTAPIHLREDYPTPAPRYDFALPYDYVHHLCYDHTESDRPLWLDHFRFVTKFKCPVYGHVAPYVFTVFRDGKCNLIHPNAFHPGEPYAYLREHFAAWLKCEMVHDFSDTLTEAWTIVTGSKRIVLPELFVDTSRWLFCSLCAKMHSVDSFSRTQRNAPPDNRECMNHTYIGDAMMFDTDGDQSHTAGYRRRWIIGIEHKGIEGDHDEIVQLAAQAKNSRDARLRFAKAIREIHRRGN